MNNEFSINDLNGFGLTNREAKVYLALMEKKYLSVPEIARLSNVPRTRIYDSLKSLELKGLCQVITGKPKLYSAVAPYQLEKILSKLEYNSANLKIKEYEEKIQKEKIRLATKLEKAKSFVNRISPIYQKSRENEHDINYIEVIKDSTLHTRVCEYLANLQNELLVFSKPPFSSEEELSEQEKIQSKAMAKGVIIKGIVQAPQDKEEIEPFIDELEAYQAKGQQIKVAERLPLKLIIFDERIVIYSLEDNLTYTTSLTASIVKHKNMAELAKIFFKMMWEKSEDFNEYSKRMKIK